MIISRRQAFQAGGGLLMAKVLSVTVPEPVRGVFGWLAPASAGAQSAATGLSLDEFSPHVGTRFNISLGGSRQVATTLAEARPREPHPLDRAGVNGESFSVLFASDQSSAFPHGTYMLDHATMGSFQLFLVAVGAGVNGQRYEAVVDRRVLAA